MTAVRDGRSVDTSMSMTPLDGVPMCTRSGAIDPGVLLWLLEGDRLTLREVTDGLYRRSGLLGLSGLSDDTRDLVAAADASDGAARLALDHYSYRICREIAAVSVSLDRLDALVLTGEIGWDQPEIRAAVCAGLGILGVRPPVRDRLAADGPISAPDAPIPVLVIEPREDLELARETLAALAAVGAPDHRSV